jgi:predicted ATPase
MTPAPRRPFREFGGWLRARRLARRWTQEELAHRLGYDVTYVRKIEWGARKATEGFRARLAEVFELPVESLPDARATLDRGKGLPTPATSLIGREEHLEGVSALLLGATKLVTLVGAPGIGKTRLAIEVATRLDDRLEHGARFVPLLTVSEPTGVAGAVCETLGLGAAGPGAAERILLDHLRSQELLLVLDNFEHVLPAADMLARLLDEAPMLRVLATSREPLRVAGEHQYPVPPLPVGSVEASMAAVSLFVDRARMVRPDFTLAGDAPASVAAICARLDGVPLAIELAAASSRLMSPSELLGELEHVLDLPTTGPRDAPVHQQTLRATIDWSHRLLDEEARTLFARLGVFVGGFTLEAAAAVCGLGESDRSAVVAGVAALVQKSMLETSHASPGGSRLVYLEAMREYAVERLEERGERETLGHRHAAYFVEIAETAATHLTGKEQVRWLAILDDEHANLRAALRWSLGADPALALRLAGALWRFWMLRGHVTEGRRWLDQALGKAAPDDRWRARASTGGAVLAGSQGDYPRAQELLREAAALARHSVNSGIVEENQGRYEEAAALFEEALSIYRAAGNQRGIGHALNGLGNVALDRGDDGAATTCFEKALAAFRSVEDQWSVALACTNLGWVTQRSGDSGGARTWFGRSLSLHRALGHERGIANALCNIGRVASREGDVAATAYLEEAVLRFRRLGERRGVAECLEELAGVAIGDGNPARAARLYSAAGTLRETIGAPLWPAELEAQTRTLEALRARLGPVEFEQAWADGRVMSTDDAVSLALTRPS